MSLRLRLTLWHTLLLGLALAGFALLVYFAFSRQLANDLDHEIELRALQASRALRAVSRGWPNAQPRLVDLPATGALADNGLYVQIVNPSGEVLATSPNLSEPLPVPAASLRQVLDGQETHDRVDLPNERVELYSAPMLVDGNVVGMLQVAAPVLPMEATLVRLRLVLLGLVLGATALAAVLGWVLVTRAMRPVDRMTQTAHAIGHSADFSRRVSGPAQRDELGRLAATFNEMLGQLDQAFTTQRRFLADASHELRSPLAAIRINVEALLRGAGAEADERDDTLRAIARETDRMGRLVADLLALANADAGQPLERRRIALDSLLLDVYRQEKRLANGIELSLGELEQAEVEGDPDRLKQLVLNLVDNALRYTPAGGSVTLDLVRADGQAVLRVRDTGPGIPIEHQPRIFERFYRVDRPRSREAGGTGLGLAICQWVADAHGGRIELESREGLGSIFTVYLPLSTPVARQPVLPAV